jgi:hypothetical protein
LFPARGQSRSSKARGMSKSSFSRSTFSRLSSVRLKLKSLGGDEIDPSVLELGVKAKKRNSRWFDEISRNETQFLLEWQDLSCFVPLRKKVIPFFPSKEMYKIHILDKQSERQSN